MEFKTVSVLALKDISNYLEEKGVVFIPYKEYWDVFPNTINTKETRSLNKKLGVCNINYTSEKMKRK
jgi:hypothetical protein